jgi:hypothetical protein
MQESKMNQKDRLWRNASVIAIMFVLLNPEMIELALFLDAVGLEIFLMLLGIQISVIFGLLFGKIEVTMSNLKYFILNLQPRVSWESIKEAPERLLLAVPDQSTLLHILVFSAVLDLLLKAKL